MNATTTTTTTFECDFCQAQVPLKDKHYALQARPSDPSEIVAVMWGCPDCGKKHGLAGPAELKGIEDDFDTKGYTTFCGPKSIFLTI